MKVVLGVDVKNRVVWLITISPGAPEIPYELGNVVGSKITLVRRFLSMRAWRLSSISKVSEKDESEIFTLWRFETEPIKGAAN